LTAIRLGEEERKRIEEKAARLFVEFDNNPCPTARANIYRWIEECDEHAVAFARVQSAWRKCERMKALSADQEGTGAAFEVGSPAHETASSFSSRRKILGGLAAAASIATIVPIWKMFHSGWQEYETKIGERRSVRIADGSMVHLNTATRLAVKLDADLRHIRLYAGEASFDVAHDKTRPFEVEVNGSIIRAVGTSFNVRLNEMLVDLTVIEGIVAITQRGRTAERLEAGRSAIIHPDTLAVKPLNEVELSQRTAWHQDMIELNGDSVEQAVAEFNRYLEKPIIIGDTHVGSMHIGGRFNTHDAERFLVALEHSLPIRAIRSADGSVVLVHSSE
tara:strand:- start:9689 stop:10690 length:1002 start_codon:yes stop_codon:yes gene_type:complete